jgi:hypothetical protein
VASPRHLQTRRDLFFVFSGAGSGGPHTLFHANDWSDANLSIRDHRVSRAFAPPRRDGSVKLPPQTRRGRDSCRGPPPRLIAGGSRGQGRQGDETCRRCPIKAAKRIWCSCMQSAHCELRGVRRQTTTGSIVNEYKDEPCALPPPCTAADIPCLPRYKVRAGHGTRAGRLPLPCCLRQVACDQQEREACLRSCDR